MDFQLSEGVVAESKAQPTPPSEIGEETGLGNVNGSAYANNNLVSSTPPLDQPPTSSVDVGFSAPTVNGTAHETPLVNGNQTASSPPATSLPVDPPSEPSAEQPQAEGLPLASEDVMSSIPQIPLASASDSAPIQAQPEIEPTPVTEPQPPTEPTIAPSEPQPLEVPPIDTSEILEPLAPQATSTDAQSSLPPSLLFEHETSDVRESGEPMSLADAADIKDEKHQADLAADEELAEGLATSTSDPINRSLPEPHAPEPTPEDRMDVTMEAETSATEPVAQLPHRTQPTDESDAPPISEPAPTIAPVTTDVPADQEMADAPTPSVKVAREREDDEHEDERVAKRSKTNEADSSPAEFKVPKLPATRSNENIATRDTAAIEPPSTLTPPQHKHLQKALGTIKRQKDAAWFLAPVDFVALNIPTYPDIIKNPMDLGTIEKKLKGGEYKALEEIITDFDLILSNATAFNGPDHDVTKAARKIRGSFDDYLAKLPSSNQVELSAAEKKAQKAAAAATTKVTPARRESRSGAPNPRSPATNAGSPSSQTFALNPEGVPLIRRDSMAGDGRPKREIHPPKNRALDYGPSKPKKKKYAWELKFCQHVLDEMMKPKYQHLASPFYVPVDPVALNIPNYHKIIKKPMDLSTVGQKLKHGQYENAKEFESDVRLMFQNCYKFNQVGDYVYTAGKSLEQEFDREWERKKKWISDNAPNSNPQSQGSSPEPEEDDEDEVEDEEEEADDDGDTQLSILQKQIAAMSKQVEMIQKKKASPPAAPGKKSKNKTAKKEKKPAAPATASKKKAPGKSGKAEKIPYVTYDQKKLISDRINDLSEVKMGQALKIIRENVPHLRDVNEEEIELDIDELPNDVLYQLLKFVKTGTNTTDEVEEPVRRKNTASAVPTKPKKNKPMGKHEQEAQISSIQARLAKFENGGAEDPDAMRSIEQGESSSDGDGSDESEEE